MRSTSIYRDVGDLLDWQIRLLQRGLVPLETQNPGRIAISHAESGQMYANKSCRCNITSSKSFLNVDWSMEKRTCPFLSFEEMDRRRKGGVWRCWPLTSCMLDARPMSKLEESALQKPKSLSDLERFWNKKQENTNCLDLYMRSCGIPV